MVDAVIPLVETKLHPPRRRGSVERPRLRSRLERPHRPALTLVAAAAGFGKTTLVADWVAEGPATAWLSLDRRDDDPAQFWTYLVAAIQTAVPDLGTATRALLAAAPPPIDAVVATLLNELHAVPHDVVIVLDDYHVIESTDIHESMAFLLDHLPTHVHLVIATRADPPLPLATLRARGELVEIRAADLRFTTDEATRYLQDAMSLPVSPADVVALDARTEGWIAALQLAAVSLQGRDDVAAFIDDFAGDDRFVLDYLAGEVLDRQPADVRQFLLETSILSRFTAPLCEAVTGRSGARATLEHLERANLFLVPLDDRRTWFRYHHLFADVLRARLLDERPELVPDLHRRAGDWFDAAGDPVEAITHLMAADDPDRAAELIELAAPALRRHRREAMLRTWVEALPGELFLHRPVLTMALVGARMATGDLSGAETLLDQAEAAMGSDDPAPIVADRHQFEALPAQVEVQRAGLSLMAGDLDGARSHAQRVLDLVGPDDHLQRGAARALLGIAHWAVGDLEAAERGYRDGTDSLMAADHLPDALGCSLALADIQMARGHLGDALHTLEVALEWTDGQPGLRGAADMHVAMSELSIERDDLDAAARHLAASDELGEHTGLPQHAYRWRVAAARLRQARGDIDGAIELFDEAAPRYDTDFSPPVRPVTALRARALLARGDLDGACRWAADEGLAADDDLSYVREFEHLTLARVLLARHLASADDPSPSDAIDLLRRLLAAAEDGGRGGSAIEALALLSVALRRDGDHVGAATASDEARRRAAVEGHVRILLDALPDEAPPSPTRAAPTSSGGLVDPLSARELDVLRLLRSELSGPDIASELFISLNTFRTHTKNVYAKLGVNNRREAVRRAAELGL